MQKIWVPIKFDKRYLVSNCGDVYSIRFKRYLTPYSDQTGRLRVNLGSKSTKKRNIAVHILVYSHFKADKLIKYKQLVMHVDYNKENNKEPNLDAMKRGDVIRLWNEQKNKIRGVYKHQIKSSNRPTYESWRAVVKFKNKVKTLGYYKTREEAILGYYEGYKNIYGRPPFQMDAQ